MTKLSEEAVELARRLIRCPSVTPHEAGALDLLEQRLTQGGFRCRRLLFSEDGTPPVDNLFARIGTGSPHLCFGGHSDVVPPGDDARTPPLGSQKHDPFPRAYTPSGKSEINGIPGRAGMA